MVNLKFFLLTTFCKGKQKMSSKAPFDSDARLNPRIEAFAEYRDHVMRRFRFSRNTIIPVTIVAAVIPFFVFAKSKDLQVCLSSASNYIIALCNEQRQHITLTVKHAFASEKTNIAIF